MKQKNLIIAIVVIVLLLIGGYYYFNSRGGSPVNIPGVTNQQGGSPFASIQEALTGGLSLKCEYPDDEGNTVTVYIKNGMTRTMGFAASGEEGYGQALMRDNKIYMWDEVKKEGIMMEFNPQEMQEAADSMEGEESDTSSDQGKDYLEELEKYKDSCKQESVDDSLFVVPADVNFTDFSQMMQQQMPQGSGDDAQSAPNFEELMQQYGQEAQ